MSSFRTCIYILPLEHGGDAEEQLNVQCCIRNAATASGARVEKQATTN